MRAGTNIERGTEEETIRGEKVKEEERDRALSRKTSV